MDENKEFLETENVSEETENFNTDTINDLSESPAQTDEGYASAFGDELTDMEYSLEQPAESALPAKKKGLIQLPVIISAAILLVVALSFFVFKCFFNTSIVGSWTMERTSTADEASSGEEEVLTYYTFDKDGTLTISTGTMKYVGTYQITAGKDGKRTVALNITQMLQNSFEYRIEGNAFTGRKLTFVNAALKNNGNTDENAQAEYEDIVFRYAKLEKPKLEVSKDFKPNDKITGKWKLNDGMYINMWYEFRDDGTVTVAQSDTLYVDGVYSYTKDEIIIKYYINEELEIKLPYETGDGYLMLNSIKFPKDAPSTADQA